MMPGKRKLSGIFECYHLHTQRHKKNYPAHNLKDVDPHKSMKSARRLTKSCCINPNLVNDVDPQVAQGFKIHHPKFKTYENHRMIKKLESDPPRFLLLVATSHTSQGP
jgi:hypothetical protein